jgi:hypothetical protein
VLAEAVVLAIVDEADEFVGELLGAHVPLLEDPLEG